MEKISSCVTDSSNDTFSLKCEAVAASLPDCDNDWLCPKLCQTKTNTPSQLHHVIRYCLQYLMIKVYVVLIATPWFGFSFDSAFTNLQVCFFVLFSSVIEVLFRFWSGCGRIKWSQRETGGERGNRARLRGI